MKVFENDYANNYDSIYSHKKYIEECDLIEDIIKKFSNENVRKLLDIGCGTGTHAIEFLKRSYEVTGIDISSQMLKVAEEKVTKLGLKSGSLWVNCDAKNFTSDEKYDLGIMMFSVIGYIIENDQLIETLQNIRRNLRNNALFICEYWNGLSVLQTKPENKLIEVILSDKSKILRSSTTLFDVFNQVANVKFKLLKIDSKSLLSETNEEHWVRYFYPHEFKLLLQASGFELLSMTANSSPNKKLTELDPTALVVARAI